MSNKWINIILEQKIKIDFYFKNPFLELLLKKDKKYSDLAKDYASYLEIIKDDIDIIGENEIDKIIKYLKSEHLSIDYIEKKYNYIYKNNYNNEINFPIISENEEKLKDYKWLWKFNINNKNNQILYETYILPFLLPINSWWNIEWIILWFNRKNPENKNLNYIYDKFLYIDSNELNSSDWKDINFEEIFNNLDKFCDYKFFDIDLVEKYSEQFQNEEEKIDKQIKNSEISKQKGNIKIESSKFLTFISSYINQKWWIKNILMNFEESINWENFSSNNYEQCILLLETQEKLKGRDSRRYFSWSVPYANYVFNNFLDTEKDNFPELETKILSENNPLILKYNNILNDDSLDNILEKKFKFITEYLNEVSHTIDAAWIWWMSGATDFLQLYKYVMMEEIIKKEERIKIIKELFNVLKYDKNKNKDVNDFIKNYDNFIKVLKEKNINNDKRLSRLYNRLYFIFSFVLNNQNPEEFPIYFSATRNTLRIFWWVEWYENIVKVYKEFLKEEALKNSIDEYVNQVWIKQNNYSLENILWFNEKLFTSHAKYRFFQDFCWVLNRNVLGWKDYVNNLWKWKTFNLNELKNKIYPFEEDERWKLKENEEKSENKKVIFWEIININYLTSGWYITEVSPWEYKVLKTDPYFIKDKKPK